MLTGIRLSGWLAHRFANLELSPLTVIAGPNGSGKSSVADAIAFAITGELRRVETKGDRKALLTEGVAKGEVELRGDGGTLIRDIPTGKITQPAGIVPADLPDGALDVLLAPDTFARMPADARRTLLFQLTGASLSPETVRAMLIERGHPEAEVQKMPLIGTPSAWHKDATTMMSESRGAWKATTGEVWGSQKAEGWTAPEPAALDGKDTAELREQIRLLEQAIATENRKLGAMASAGNAPVEDPEALRRRADQLPGWVTADAEAHAAFLDAKRELREAQDALAALPGAADAPDRLSCPDCGSLLMLDPEGRGKHLVAHAAPDPIAAQQARQRADRVAAEAREKLAEAEAAAQNASARLAASQAARRALDAMGLASQESGAPDLLTETPATIEARLADHQRALDQVREDLAGIGKHAELVKRAREKTEKAARAHRDVKVWAAIAADLAPDGIPAEVLGKALKPVNDGLTKLAAVSGWAAVSIGGDMSITAAGRAYGLLSESERWRADALLALALAEMTGARLVVLDRFDVLDLPSRGRALRFLFDVAQQPGWSVIVAGTFKAPPQVPPAIRVHWLGPDAREQAA